MIDILFALKGSQMECGRLAPPLYRGRTKAPTTVWGAIINTPSYTSLFTLPAQPPPALAHMVSKRHHYVMVSHHAWSFVILCQRHQTGQNATMVKRHKLECKRFSNTTSSHLGNELSYTCPEQNTFFLHTHKAPESAKRIFIQSVMSYFTFKVTTKLVN